MEYLSNNNLPKPTKLGSRLGKNLRDVLSFAANYVPIAGPVINSFMERQFKIAENTLIKEIGLGKLELISSEEFQYLLNNFFAYFEAARNGEHEHNLRILAHILKQQIPYPKQAPFAVKSAARKLEGFSIEDLNALNSCYNSFEYSKLSKNYELFSGNYIWTTSEYLSKELNIDTLEGRAKSNSYLAHFMSRGLLFVDGIPGVMGGVAYFKTAEFDEIINAAKIAGLEITE